MHNDTCFGVAALACCGLFVAGSSMAQVKPRSSSDAPAEATTARAGSPVDGAFALDVAGVRLGMSATEARTALSRAGYRVSAERADFDRDPSFAERVRTAAAQRRTGSYAAPSRADRVVARIEGIGPHRESARIRLVAVPTGGSAVAEVQLDVPTEVMTEAAFLKQAEARYGRPDGRYDSGTTLTWCSPAVRRLCAAPDAFGPSPGALPNLKATTILASRTIRLVEGTDQERQRERDFAAAVDRAAPKTDRAAF